MKNVLLLALSVFLSANKSVLTKMIKSENESFLQTMKKNILAFFIGFLILLCLGASHLQTAASAPFLLSFLYAFFTLLAQVAFAVSVSIGPCSISTLFYSCGFIIPTLWGSLYYQEGLSPIAIAGLVLILATFVLFTQKDKKMKIRFLWIITALLGFIGCGLMGVIQKIFIKNNPHLSLQLFLIPAFAFVVALGALFLAFLYLFNKKKSSGDKNFPQNKSKESLKKIAKKNRLSSILFTLFLGVTLGVVHTVNTHLTGAFPSYITFPVINGGMVVATSIFSFLYFKEPLSKKKFFGLFTSIIGIILLSIG